MNYSQFKVQQKEKQKEMYQKMMSQSSSDNKKEKKEQKKGNKEDKEKKEVEAMFNMKNILLGGVGSAILAPLVTKYLLKMDIK